MLVVWKWWHHRVAFLALLTCCPSLRAANPTGHLVEALIAQPSSSGSRHQNKVENVQNWRDYNRKMKGVLIACVIMHPPNHCNAIQLTNGGPLFVSLTLVFIRWWKELLASADIFYPWYFPSNQEWVCFLIPFTFVVRGNNYSWWYCTTSWDLLLLLISG